MSGTNPNILFRYDEFQIDAQLQDYVRKFWVLDNLMNFKPLAGKQLLPNGCFNLAFIAGNGVVASHQGKKTRLVQGIYLCGQFTSSLSISILAHTKIILAQLFPWTPSMLTQLPLHEITNQVIGISDAIPQLNTLSVGQLLEESQIKVFLSNKILESLHTTKNAKVIQESCLLMRQAGGNMSIKELADAMGYSSRYVEKKFKAHLGLKPKEFATILKVRSLIDELRLFPNRPQLTELAYKYGFYDQAHFIKTFKNILNISPKEFKSPNYILPKGKGF